MRRKTRKHVLHIAIFVAVLLLVIFLTSSGSSSHDLSWTAVRYVTSSSSLPPSHGICPGLSSNEKPVLVVSRISSDDDPTWLDPLIDKYHLCIYNNDAPHAAGDPPVALRVPANRGHEAMSYLTFIIDNYANIPAAGAVFIHGAQRAWHNDAADYDNRALLRALDIPAALDLTGYHNLRCDWSAGTCDPNALPKVAPPASFETRMSALLEPFNKRAVSDAALPAAFVALFAGEGSAGNAMLGSGDFLRAQCCAQFVVSRERIWQHTHDEYMALRQWLLDDGAAPSDDRVAGRIMSYVWHVLFLPQDGERSVLASSGSEIDLDALNTLACPTAKDCYCRLYGRCGLETCREPGRCTGEYVLPRDYKVPQRYLTSQG